MNALSQTTTSGTKAVKAAVLLIFALLLFAPFLFQDVRALEVAARVCVFIVLVASYDLLIGYTGIVSFAHTMFFGFGAYGAAISLKQMGPGWDAVVVGALAGMGVSLIVAVAIGLLSLRVKAIFFAMITLATASVALVLASQLSDFTGGEDGITYRAPALFKTATKLMLDENGKVLRIFGVKINGKLAAYYFVFFSCLALFVVMLRMVGSPLGTVLKAIRENEARAEAIGYRVVSYRTFVFCIAALVASLAGTIYAIWLKYTGPDTALSFAIMIDILLMVVIGGMGTMWGAVIGATMLVLAQYYLRDLMGAAAKATVDIPILPHVLDPDRWLFWLGIIFILLVYFFPKGIAGTVMAKGAPR
ncbi:branched-chain amino acid ABC transporter permease [Sulfitobacter mediterraneus]|uniref:branched-chain amino acid ABC transporter permease n=1 Tax=Sulfitobacter mediterraneus TaxID=83219 RepID=UPI001939A660|nr:branched-chain amino acid ABC transporter permease [Sulfitobacter mediterraneus]MBM1557880.1 branched-chain amino acid ABC transporter permease [Sulfitobacter mediterraneus]MBM1568745.1 branched-chain amino acid ABC transporter permease [Sulfitobacter mediterraneus]MBM1573053.1 branched-chain amino acid ABC transporter permease [Sulfitobacter mediterraneus]MBM1576254.1 branched-chain amino acid ABC transporter permease [Sulfitobacter mediterraneus]MBM1580838.1 branched-chain amino acid ABC 